MKKPWRRPRRPGLSDPPLSGSALGASLFPAPLGCSIWPGIGLLTVEAFKARELLDRVVRDLDDGGQVLWIKRAKTRRGNRKLRVPEPARSWLLRLSVDRKQEDFLIPGARRGCARSTSWLGMEVARLCAAAGVTAVCTHGLRGTHSTMAEGAGISPDAVAASLGHTDPRTTVRHYTMPEARQGAQQDRFLKVLAGGRRS